jgi:hypothetical protein
MGNGPSLTRRAEAPSQAQIAGAPLPAKDPWDCLRVVRRLEVGPAQLEPRRVVVPYTVMTDGSANSTALIYKYERDVFDPGDPVAQNLASVMGAQLALNYGLFAEEVRFVGTFDEIDRKFLADMAENTAREITVKKFLEPNAFLQGPAAHLPLIRRERYCRARIEFAEFAHPAREHDGNKSECWGADTVRYAILSSGGKESLLTHGLLREMGCDVYPIFLNESGRHWLTALNGYRHLARSHPGTERVWTNCDRVFSWFLRRFPFVRQDFANVRSDEYPIRLWTVAVFLFGALPLLRFHRIGNLLIGDEYDTTRKTDHRGILHYDGLFDQSRYFDKALTRYFRRKGYCVEQFSLLRCLSELLVQRTLAQRYPDLFEHQVSCHAAHVERDRVRPCGRCEKCRRVVAMLVAFGLRPTDCGYADGQVSDCLAALAAGGVNQETYGAQHLAHLLWQRGLLHAGATGLPRPKPRPEVLKLRFDPDRSLLEEVPTQLRQQLLSILLQQCDGAVKRVGREWVDFDPLEEASGRSANRSAMVDDLPEQLQNRQ